MKSIAHKSFGMIFLFGLGILIIGFLVFYVSQHNFSDIYPWSLSGVIVVLLIVIIYQLFQPSVLISENEEGFIIHRKGYDCLVRFSDIEGFDDNNAKVRGIHYSFGSITIFTREDSYYVGNIANVKQVRDYMASVIKTKKVRSPYQL